MEEQIKASVNKSTAEASCNFESFAHNTAVGWKAAEKSPPTAATKQKFRGKSLGEKPPMGKTGWWDVGLIKGCCHCGVLVTHSYPITEISV